MSSRGDDEHAFPGTAPGRLSPRPAATIMVLRDGPRAGVEGGSLEVLMLRRNLRADFVGGAFVFPGGSLDPGDATLEAALACDGLDDETASGLLGIDSGGLAYWIAAVRECFEEAGVLLARRASEGRTVSFSDPADAGRFLAYRHDLNAGKVGFLDVLAAEDLRLELRDIGYVAHWITPEGSPRRYDTRFFVAAAPDGQIAAHDAGETISDVWIRPADALDRYRSGQMTMILPTIRNLEMLAGFASARAVVEAAARLREVPAVLPRLVEADEGAQLLIPGDPGYEDPSLRPGDPSMLDSAVRKASARREAGARRAEAEDTGASR